MEKQEFLEKYIADRHNTNCSKWDGLKEKFGEDGLLPMWVADMEFKTCDGITDALVERAKQGIFGYGVVPDEYYELFSKWMERHHGFAVKKEWVRFCTGCVTAIAWMIHAYTQPGDACLILTPVYYPFHNVVTNNNRKLVTADLKYENGHFSMDYEAIEKAITEQNVKLFLMCSPHNPAGRVWTEEELDHVLAICKKHNVLVVADEIHQDIVFGENHFVPAAAVAGGKYQDILLVLNSSSKTFNLATLIHSHIVIINDKLREIYDKFASGLNRTEVSVMGMIATMAGYKTGDEWLSNVLEVIGDNYKYLKETLETELPGVVVCSMEGTYLPMIDLRAWVKPEETHDFIQGKCHLAVDYGEWFGAGYEGFIRMNLATDPVFVKQAAETIIREAKKLKEK